MTKPIKTKKARLAWGEGTIAKRGDRFRIRWYENGAQCSETHATEDSAKEALKHISERIRHGLSGLPVVAPAPAVAEPKRFDALVPDWIDYRKAHGIRSADEDRARWNKHLAARLAPLDIDTVTALTVRGIAQELVKPSVGVKAEPVSGPTAHRAITLLSAFYTWAIDQGHAVSNPARQALTNKDTKKLLRSTHEGEFAPFLKTRADVAKLHTALTKIDPTVAVAYALSAYAGLRPGEVIALDWESVDLAHSVITVSKQVRSGKLGPTKSGKTREAPITPTLHKILTAARKAQQLALGKAFTGACLVCPPPRRTRKDGSAGSVWGTFLGPKSVTPALADAFKACKLESLTLYEAGRHTFASLAALGGISTWRLKAVMGHSDIKTTERYISLRGQTLSKAEISALGG